MTPWDVMKWALAILVVAVIAVVACLCVAGIVMLVIWFKEEVFNGPSRKARREARQ